MTLGQKSLQAVSQPGWIAQLTLPDREDTDTDLSKFPLLARVALPILSQLDLPECTPNSGNPALGQYR